MHIAMMGLNFKTAPVQIREVLAVPSGGIPAALERLGALPALEGVLLSTCNRTELYLVGDGVDELYDAMTHYLMEMGGIADARRLTPHLYRFSGQSAVNHLFRVACGLDSMVIGETQILGQVRDAYRASTEAGIVGKTLHQLFEQAIAVGKRAQTETRIGQNAVSVSYAAVELAKRVFRSLDGRRCMAIGAGETAKLTVKHLQASGVKDIIIANRTLDRAENLARLIGGTAVPMAEVSRHLQSVDVVISSTGAPGYVLTRAQVAEAVRQRRGRPIFLFDIAVPRDIDPEIGQLEGAFVYDIDDLQAVVNANLQERAEEAKRVERIVEEELDKFQQWLATQQVIPTIRQLRDKVDTLRQQELARAFNRMPDLTDRERAVIEAMTVTLVNKILNAPTQHLKGMAGEGSANEAIATVARLFELPNAEAKPVAKEGGG
ncbi:MAG TPA: glutamyl-tRNA reductase [Symbiobacteriaceae bacterium]|nr:glutamyl-tRNA reductase [Symbiobacteriaceae bacterium]